MLRRYIIDWSRSVASSSRGWLVVMQWLDAPARCSSFIVSTPRGLADAAAAAAAAVVSDQFLAHADIDLWVSRISRMHSHAVVLALRAPQSLAYLTGLTDSADITAYL